MSLRHREPAPAEMPATTIPARQGTYALLLAVERRRRITIGRLGALAAAAGCYAYIGSAFGPGGLRARLRHHLGVAQRLHWHIDYLRRIATPFEIWYREDHHGSEHVWAQTCASLAGASLPLPHFAGKRLYLCGPSFPFQYAAVIDRFRSAFATGCRGAP